MLQGPYFMAFPRPILVFLISHYHLIGLIASENYLQ